MKLRLPIFLIIIAAFALSETARAQQSPELIFGETTFDFGTIRENDGTVSHTFTFQNVGSRPVVIVSATTTCGCTVPTFSRKPVMPSQTGSVEVTFDPADRPGRFDKRVSVTISDRSEPLHLYISGNVIPREKGIDELYPIYIGSGLRAETNFHSFGYVEHGKSITTAIGLFNSSDKVLKVGIFNNSQTKAFRIVSSDMPAVLKPGDKSEIVITCNLADNSHVYGTLTEHMVFEINGRRSDAELVVTGIAIDNRDNRDDNFVPKAELNKIVVKFGALKRSEEKRTEFFDILNTGEAPLIIRAIESVAAGTELSLRVGERIAAGERRSVGITVHPSAKEYGPQVERIRIITDDPSRPMRDMKITMIVED